MKQESRFTEIDLLRFLAALSVMLLHYGIRGFAVDDNLSPLHFPMLGPLVKYNYLGVNLFFMISGFVILMTVQSKDLQGFFISRVVRLYPAYWFSCTLTFLVILLFARDEIYTSLPRYLTNMTMLNGFVNIGGIDGVYWTLCVELKFYILIGILLAFRQIPRIEKYLGAWLLLSIVLLQYPNAVLSYVFIPQYSAYFIAGSIFFLVSKQGFGFYRIFLLIASFVAGLMSDIPALIDKSLWYRMHFDIGWLVGILGMFYLVFLAISTRKSGGGRWGPLFVYLGTLSYPLYLLHNKIGTAIFWNLDPYVEPHVLLVGTAVLMLCLARLVHVQVERRFSPVLKRLLERLLVAWRDRAGAAAAANLPGSKRIELRDGKNRGAVR